MKEGSRLLLIEDDEVAASSLRQVLCEEGYAVTVVARGDVGLQSVAERNYDVVLTDLRLPGINGLDLVARAPPLSFTAACHPDDCPWYDRGCHRGD